MASLLYRIGRAAAKRAWLTITAWVVMLAVAAGGFLAFGGTLSSDITIPGTATDKVTQELSDRFSDGGGTTAGVVFSTDSEDGFTDAQREEISEFLVTLEDLPQVTGVVDPFESEASRADGQAQIDDGFAQIADGRAQLDDGAAQLADALTQLDAGQAELDAARAQAEAAGQLAFAAPQLDAQQAQLDTARAEITSQQETLEENRRELTEQTEELETSAALLKLSEDALQVSEDGSAAMATVQVDADVLPAETKEELVAAVDDLSIDGVEALPSNLGTSTPEVFGIGEVVGLVIAAITLFVMLGTLIGAGLPLINALVGVGVGVLGSLALSSVFEMNSVTPILGVMLGLAVGIDYSLFILNRHRTHLRGGMDLQESIGMANGTAGNAVVFAGATVLVALLALNVTGIPFLGLMGTVAAFCVLIAILVAVTLTPALLSLVGHRITPKKQRTAAAQAEYKSTTTANTRTIRPMRTGRAIVTLVAGLGALLVLALPALEMRLGLPDAGSEPADSAANRSFTLVEESFGEGVNAPLLVTAELPATIDEDQEEAEQVRVGEVLADFEDVTAVAPIGVSDDGKMLAFQVIPAEGPTAVSTEELVHDLRAGSDELEDVEFGVAGNATANIDVSDKLTEALPIYLLVVVGLSLLILIVVFRSILVPVTATIGFILSVLASFGAVTAIFQWGWLGDVFGVHDPGPILSFMPTLLIGILFGLAMDYQLFLVSGMREAYVHGMPARLAVTRGLRAGRSVVTAAAIIMVAVFGGFVFSHSIMIQTIGFGLAFGVLVDAFVVRMLLIPAIMHLLGDAAWWIPKWLDRILPDVDVEGAKLERAHHVEQRVETAP